MTDSKSTNNKIAVKAIDVKNTDVKNTDAKNIDVNNIDIKNIKTQSSKNGVHTHTPSQSLTPAATTYQPSTLKSPPIPKGMPTVVENHKQTEIEDKLPFQWLFLLPQYWGIWFIMGLFLLLIRLPLRTQFWIGKNLGIGIYHLAKKRQKDTLVNLKLAFPEKAEFERALMAKQVFVNQGIGVFETLCAWFRPNVFTRTMTVSGLQHIVNAQKEGRGVLMLGAHYTNLDLGARIFTQFAPLDAMYRPQNNKLLNWVVFNARRRMVNEQISHHNMSGLIKRLKEGNIVWYSVDQDFGLKRGVMAPFFGVPAATITTPRYLATISDVPSLAPVLLMAHVYRQTPDSLPRGKRPHYHITLTPPIENYPSDDEVADATRVNEILEGMIRIDPTQWMWFHRRYKNSPTGRTNYYQ